MASSTLSTLSPAEVDETLTLPSGMAAGRYALSLALPDPGLADRPEYAIRLANEDAWDEETGRNDLQHAVTVSARSAPPNRIAFITAHGRGRSEARVWLTDAIGSDAP